MDEQAEPQRTYPPGVPCWVDLDQPDVEVAIAFYGGLFGWEFTDVMPPGAPGSYLIARLFGKDVAAISSDEPASGWNTYLAVADADTSAAAVTAAGGQVAGEPRDAGPGGRLAHCTDPDGAAFRLWQARRRLGAQLVNVPGTWNFSILHTADAHRSLAFYAAVFDWRTQDFGDDAEAMVQLPGYGDHLAATADPQIYERQAFAPAGFADVVAALTAAAPGERSHWHVQFAVADRDDTARLAEKLGGEVVSTTDLVWNRVAVVRDPQGAEFTVSQFTPPGRSA